MVLYSFFVFNINVLQLQTASFALFSPANKRMQIKLRSPSISIHIQITFYECIAYFREFLY
jgi:hypothetical protein